MKFLAGLDFSGLMIAGNAKAGSSYMAGLGDHCRIPGRRLPRRRFCLTPLVANDKFH